MELSDWWGPPVVFEMHAVDPREGFAGLTVASSVGLSAATSAGLSAASFDVTSNRVEPDRGGGWWPDASESTGAGSSSQATTAAPSPSQFFSEQFDDSSTGPGIGATAGMASPMQDAMEPPAWPGGFQGIPGFPGPGGRDGGDELMFSRGPDPGTFAMLMSGGAGAAYASPAFADARAADPGALIAGPLGGLAVPNGPGSQALGTFGPGAGVFSTAGGPSLAVAATAPAQPAQPPSTIAADGPSADRSAAPAVVGTPRLDGGMSLDASRAIRSSGRAILATTLSQSLLSPSTLDLDPAESGALEAPPTPRGADLVAEALPFAGDSLERSLDDFVRQLESGDVSALVSEGPAPLLVASIAVATAAASTVVAREIIRRKSARGRGLRIVDTLGRELALSFPELPRSWSEKRR